MSPFKRTGSPYWQVWPTVVVPGEGRRRIGPWSTRTKDYARADKMESTLQELPLMGYGDVLKMLLRKETTVQEIYAAKLGGGLDELRSRSGNPLLKDAVGEEDQPDSFVATRDDDRVRAGARHIVRLVVEVSGDRAPRMSWLKEPKNVEAMLKRREREGLKRNSVRRSLYRAVAELLEREIGRQDKTAVLAEVRFAAEDDERDIRVTPGEIQRLLGACIGPLFREAVEFAVTSGIDRTPLLRIRPRYFDESTGELQVLDRKTKARPRTIQLSETAQASLRRAIVMGRAGMDALVFDWSVGQFRHRWDAACERAELPWLRFKDLRAVFATAYLTAGGSVKNLQQILGHADVKTTIRYLKRIAARHGLEMQATADHLGLGRMGLKVEDAS